MPGAAGPVTTGPDAVLVPDEATSIGATVGGSTIEGAGEGGGTLACGVFTGGVFSGGVFTGGGVLAGGLVGGPGAGVGEGAAEAGLVTVGSAGGWVGSCVVVAADSSIEDDPP